MKHVKFCALRIFINSPVIVSNEMPRHFIQIFIVKEYRSLRVEIWQGFGVVFAWIRQENHFYEEFSLNLSRMFTFECELALL